MIGSKAGYPTPINRSPPDGSEAAPKAKTASIPQRNVQNNKNLADHRLNESHAGHPIVQVEQSSVANAAACPVNVRAMHCRPAVQFTRYQLFLCKSVSSSSNLVYVSWCIIQPSASTGCRRSARAHGSSLDEQIVCSDDMRIHQRRSVPRQSL
jgi:hypothetical protein